MDLNEVVKIALARALKIDPAAIDAGTFRLDGTRIIIDLSGTLVKQEAEWHVPTTSIPLIASLALAVRDMGVQRERFMEKLEVAMNAALAMDEKGEEYVNEFNNDCAAITEKVRASAKSLPPRRHEGKIIPRGVRIDMTINLGPALVATATATVPITI